MWESLLAFSSLCFLLLPPQKNMPALTECPIWRRNQSSFSSLVAIILAIPTSFRKIISDISNNRSTLSFTPPSTPAKCNRSEVYSSDPAFSLLYSSNWLNLFRLFSSTIKPSHPHFEFCQRIKFSLNRCRKNASAISNNIIHFLSLPFLALALVHMAYLRSATLLLEKWKYIMRKKRNHRIFFSALFL